MSKYIAEQVNDGIAWLNAKFQRHGEQEDKDCADMLREFATLLREREAAKAGVTKEPRFFIDHGMIHDRVTGKHVTCDPDFRDYVINPGETTRINNPDGISNTCELLNSLAGAPMPASARVPDGWQLVPIDPTHEMCGAPDVVWHPEAKRIYQQMLAAAPKPEAEG